MSRHIPFVTTSYFEQREAKQGRLISLLINHVGEDKVAAFFSQWINTPPTPASAQERQALEAYDNAMDEMIVRIFGLLTADQKDHLRKKISGYIDDLRQLHSASGTLDAANAPRNAAPQND